jgi:hypothetical protein
VWARVDKIDRIRPQPNGGAIVLVEDERNVAGMSRFPPLSVTVAIARVLNARRVLEVRYAGKGEVRYAAAAMPPSFLTDAIARAGASVTDRTGEQIAIPANPGSVGAVLDNAFAELAHNARTGMGLATLSAALQRKEAILKKTPIDRAENPAAYWTAVFELCALAGELSRARGGRWIETAEGPVPFAIKLATGELAVPAKQAQRIVEGKDEDTLVTPEQPEGT